MKKFVLTKNSFYNSLGLTNHQMNEVKGGALKNDDPYLPTHAGGSEEEAPSHNFTCDEGYEWNPILGMCVEI